MRDLLPPTGCKSQAACGVAKTGSAGEIVLFAVGVFLAPRGYRISAAVSGFRAEVSQWPSCTSGKLSYPPPLVFMSISTPLLSHTTFSLLTCGQALLVAATVAGLPGLACLGAGDDLDAFFADLAVAVLDCRLVTVFCCLLAGNRLSTSPAAVSLVFRFLPAVAAVAAAVRACALSAVRPGAGRPWVSRVST
jgi:hypothetical protein